MILYTRYSRLDIVIVLEIVYDRRECGNHSGDFMNRKCVCARVMLCVRVSVCARVRAFMCVLVGS